MVDKPATEHLPGTEYVRKKASIVGAGKEGRMSFYVGQKVVCVDDSPSTVTLRRLPLKVGIEYTVSKIVNNATGIEINGSEAHCYWNWRFRPIEENFAERTLNKAIEQAEEILEIIETVQPEREER